MNNHSLKRSPKKGQRADDKRGRILDAAVKIFAREGFYNAKVAQIADAAGVADGTIYLYFKNKDDLLICLFEDRMEQINTRLRQAIEGVAGACAQLERIVALLLDLVESNRHMAEVITVELRQSAKFMKEYKNPKFAEFLRLIAGVVEHGQASGELRHGIDPPVVARALFGAVNEIALQHLVRAAKDTKNDLFSAATQLSRLFIDGLRKQGDGP